MDEGTVQLGPQAGRKAAMLTTMFSSMLSNQALTLTYATAGRCLSIRRGLGNTRPLLQSRL